MQQKSGKSSKRHLKARFKAFLGVKAQSKVYSFRTVSKQILKLAFLSRPRPNSPSLVIPWSIDSYGAILQIVTRLKHDSKQPKMAAFPLCQQRQPASTIRHRDLQRCVANQTRQNCDKHVYKSAHKVLVQHADARRGTVRGHSEIVASSSEFANASQSRRPKYKRSKRWKNLIRTALVATC